MADETEPVTPGSPVRALWPAVRGGQGARIGTKAMTCLRRYRVATVGELTAMTALDVDDIAGIGAAGVTEVRRVLRLHGLSLKDDDGTTAAQEQARVRVLTRAGLRRPLALRFARQSWPAGEIAPGVTLTVAEADRG
jgi:hypothetical protein